MTTIDGQIFDPSKWNSIPSTYREALLSRNLGGSRRPAPYRILSRHARLSDGSLVEVFDVWDMRAYIDRKAHRPTLKHAGIDDFDRARDLALDVQKERTFFLPPLGVAGIVGGGL